MKRKSLPQKNNLDGQGKKFNAWGAKFYTRKRCYSAHLAGSMKKLF